MAVVVTPTALALASIGGVVYAATANTGDNTVSVLALSSDFLGGAFTPEVNAAGQQPPVAAVSELSTALRQVATAVRAGGPVWPQPQLPRAASLELVSDAVRSVQNAVAGTPLTPTDPLVAWISPSWHRTGPARGRRGS